MIYFLLSMLALGGRSHAFAVADNDSRRVLVTGAGGQTGQHIFRKLLTKPGWTPVGMVRSEESRKALLEGTTAIGASVATGGARHISPDSVVICDICNDDTTGLDTLLKGCDALIIATSAKPAPTGEIDEETKRPKFGFPNGQPKIVDFEGQKRLIDVAKANNDNMHVVLCGSMGGTNPNHPLNNLGKETTENGKCSGGDILKWKRKAEVYLVESGLPYTIVHPGGLLNERGSERELCLGVDDVIPGTSNNSVPREDVASVMIAALENDNYRGRSFDLVSKPPGDGDVTDDYQNLLLSLGEKNCDYSLGEVA